MYILTVHREDTIYFVVVVVVVFETMTREAKCFQSSAQNTGRRFLEFPRISQDVWPCVYSVWLKTV